MLKSLVLIVLLLLFYFFFTLGSKDRFLWLGVYKLKPVLREMKKLWILWLMGVRPRGQPNRAWKEVVDVCEEFEVK